jgi:signal transduction histidine kinase
MLQESEADARDLDGHSSLVRNAVVRFAIGSVVALVILAVGTTVVGTRVAEGQALREARSRTAILAQQVAAPLVDTSLRQGKPDALARLETAMREQMRRRGLRHIKLWSATGTVLWADEPALVGKRYPMDADVTSLVGTERATAEVSTLDKAENSQERSDEKLLEVYAGAKDADGVPLVFEAYLPLDDLNRDKVAIISGVLPVGLGGLLLFLAAVLPMAVRLARRVEQSQRERTRMVRHALDASELERRRIAQQLHDGVIQDMAGIGFALPTITSQLPDDAGGREARHTLRTIEELVHKDANALRTMLIDLYPPDLGGPGLALAVREVAHGASADGVEVEVDLDPDLEVPIEVATLAYRVVREGVRNVVKHAAATCARVRMVRDEAAFVVTVEDDGRGPAATGPAGRGHIGLQLLRDTVRDLGGEVALLQGESGGAVLQARIPAALVSG